MKRKMIFYGVAIILIIHIGCSSCEILDQSDAPDTAVPSPMNPVVPNPISELDLKSWPETSDKMIRRATVDMTELYQPLGDEASSPIGVLPGPDGGKLLTRSLTLEKTLPKETPPRDVTRGRTAEELAAQNNTVVIAQVGGTATLSCYTGHISDEVVTWLKREDDQLLTIGQELYANEDRFSASLSHSSKAWELFVRDVSLSDAGQYECQLTTHPPVTFLYTLKVTQAKAEIRGSKEVHIEEGSQLDLQCIVKESPSPPVYIFWYHNGTMVNYERQRGLLVHHENFMSNLVVAKVMPSDAGIYTCDPHLATRAKVVVHVVTGEKPAAMQHGINPVEGAASVLGYSFPTVSAASLLLFTFFLYFNSLPAFEAHHNVLSNTLSRTAHLSPNSASSSVKLIQ